jgi:hypothetical protein
MNCDNFQAPALGSYPIDLTERLGEDSASLKITLSQSLGAKSFST